MTLTINTLCEGGYDGSLGTFEAACGCETRPVANEANAYTMIYLTFGSHVYICPVSINETLVFRSKAEAQTYWQLYGDVVGEEQHRLDCLFILAKINFDIRWN